MRLPWGASPPCAWYQFSIDRKGEHLANHLAGYTGTVHADGFAGFNGLFGKGKADEQACMAHVRRKFVAEVERTGFPIAQQAIKQIAKLYAMEKDVRGKDWLWKIMSRKKPKQAAIALARVSGSGGDNPLRRRNRDSLFAR